MTDRLSGAGRRRKGAVGELEVVKILRDHGWTEAARTADSRAQCGRGDIAGVPGVHLEVKRHERLNVPAAIDQLFRDCRPCDVPVLVHRSSRHPWLATMELTELLSLLQLRERGV